METTHYHIPYALHVDGSSSYIPTQVVMPTHTLLDSGQGAGDFMPLDQGADTSACSCRSIERACASCDGMACLRCLNCVDSESGTFCLGGIGSVAHSVCLCMSGGS